MRGSKSENGLGIPIRTGYIQVTWAVWNKSRGVIPFIDICIYMGMGQNLVPLVNIKIAGKWMFIPLKMVLIGIDPYPYMCIYIHTSASEWWIFDFLFPDKHWRHDQRGKTGHVLAWMRQLVFLKLEKKTYHTHLVSCTHVTMYIYII